MFIKLLLPSLFSIMFIVLKQILKIYNIENSNSVVFYIVTLKYIEVNRSNFLHNSSC